MKQRSAANMKKNVKMCHILMADSQIPIKLYCKFLKNVLKSSFNSKYFFKAEHSQSTL